jgi:putative PIN family toxin of toxin-antitoxin system
MIRVVIDTNVVVSGRLREEGHPALIMNLAVNRKIHLFISPEVWAEYEEVLCRPKFKPDPRLVAAALEILRAASTMVEPKHQARKATDKKDNRFLATAAAAGADYLITGNTRHFPTRYRKTRIVTPAEFISIITPVLGLPKTR